MLESQKYPNVNILACFIYSMRMDNVKITLRFCLNWSDVIKKDQGRGVFIIYINTKLTCIM